MFEFRCFHGSFAFYETSPAMMGGWQRYDIRLAQYPTSRQHLPQAMTTLWRICGVLGVR
jgi:hypothetical protein